MKSSRASLAMRGGIVATLLTSMLMAFAVILSPVQSAWAVGLGVETTSESDIRSYASSHDIDLDRLLTTRATYEEQPDYQNAPYAPGKLSQATENDALAFVNFARYVAGLSSDVKLNENYSAKAQASALVNCINGSLSHKPSRPSGISNELYQMGLNGSQSSNIARGYSSIANSVLGYLEDSDNSNISRVGHRRWVLNPLMEEVGFGKVGAYSAMYAHDHIPSDSCDTIVSWPAQHMPRELFGDRVAWSLTVGKKISSPSSVSVTMTRRSDGATWQFGSSGHDGDFFVDNQYYAQPGCIIFRPDDVSYNAGDTFDVTITGATSQTISYSVTFFDLVPKKTQVISCQDSYVVSEAEEGFWLDANVLGDAWLSYSSTDEDVVSVESNGHVIINGPGTAVITLTADETDDYASATKQVTVTVKVANGRYVNLPTNLEHGKVSVSPDGPIAKGATVTINLLPDELYKVEAVSAVDAYGNPVPISGNGDTRTFVMPDADVTLSVSFIESTAQMRGVGFYRTAEPKNGTVIVEGGEFQAVGSTVTLLSVPDEGYELDSISAMNCITNEYLTLSGTGDTRTFVMPDADVAIFVSFA